VAFTSAHPCPIPATSTDIFVIRTLASFISRRSAALLASAVFALWELRYETANEQACESAEEKSTVDEDLTTPPHTKVAFNGSVIEHYPGYLAKCQNHLATLVAGADNLVLAAGSIDLVPAIESSIIGAAVALGCALAEGEAA
jgi:hexokinase